MEVATRTERRGLRKDAWFPIAGFQPTPAESHYTTWALGWISLTRVQTPRYVMAWKGFREPVYAEPRSRWKLVIERQIRDTIS